MIFFVVFTKNLFALGRGYDKMVKDINTILCKAK